MSARRLTLALTAAVTAAVTALTAAAASAEPVGAAQRTAVTVRVPAARAYAGAKLSVAGTVTAAARPRTVHLQRAHGRGWVRAGTARTSRGRFTLPVPTRARGTSTYRIWVVPARGATGRASGTFRVSVAARPAGSARSYAILLPGLTRTDYSRWNPCQPIRYRVNPGRFGPGAVADARAAVARVAAASGLRFTYRGTTRAVPESRYRYPKDTQLVIAWARPGVSSMLPRGSRAVGVSTVLDVREGFTAKGVSVFAITQAGVVLNANAAYPPGFGTGNRYGLHGTRGQLLMHELGHAVGLGHTRAASQVMYPVITSKPARWGAGDLAGLAKVGKAAGCLSATRPRR